MRQILLFSCLLLIPISSYAQSSGVPDGSFFQIGDYSNSNTPKGILFTGYRDVLPNYFGASIEAINQWNCCNNYPSGGYPGIKLIGLNFNIHDPNQIDLANAKITALTIASTGNIGIGNSSPQNKLDVNGTVHAKEVKVDLAGWPDYVFSRNYNLLTLEEVERHIIERGHLPNIPSEKDVTENGLNLGDNQKLLLEKIEELMLYSIAQNKKIKLQERLLEQQDKTIKSLQSDNDKLNRSSLQNDDLLKRVEKLEDKLLKSR